MAASYRQRSVLGNSENYTVTADAQIKNAARSRGAAVFAANQNSKSAASPGVLVSLSERKTKRRGHEPAAL